MSDASPHKSKNKYDPEVVYVDPTISSVPELDGKDSSTTDSETQLAQSTLSCDRRKSLT